MELWKIIMAYQKIINLVDNVSNQPSKFRAKGQVEIKDESREGYDTNSQIKFKAAMLKPSFCDYSGIYILVKGTITVNNTVAPAVNIANKKVIFKKLCTNLLIAKPK